MTLRLRNRRALLRFAAAIGVAALVTAACGDDSAPAQPPSSTVDATIPDDHGLSDATLARVLPSTVGIQGVACGRLASGSGFALTEDLVVTNAHVILGIDEISVHTFDGRELPATAVAFDADDDLAILEVAGADLVPLPLTEKATPGSTGVLVGWETGPFADPTPYQVDRRVTVRIETVGGDERVERPAWLVAADIDVGDSGAALIDRTGEVIGVAFAASTEDEGIGYAVRSSAIEALLATGLDPNLTIPDC
jgi:S1-C subfamily serine protease